MLPAKKSFCSLPLTKEGLQRSIDREGKQGQQKEVLRHQPAGQQIGTLLARRLQHANVAVSMHKLDLVQSHLGISPPEGRHGACAMVKL